MTTMVAVVMRATIAFALRVTVTDLTHDLRT
jgi:hypothetical protein